MDEQIKQTMDYKGKQIKKFVDAKEKSMALFAAGRDATMVTCELISKSATSYSEDEIKQTVKEWRNWFYYEIYSTDPDEQVKQQAKENMTTKEILGF